MVKQLYINGEWRNAQSGHTFDVINPADESVIATVAAAQPEDVSAAVAAARQAFDEGPWPQLSGAERAHYLRGIANVIRQRLPEIARLEVADNGKPLPEAEWDIEDTAGTFDFYADLAEAMDQAEEEVVELPDDRFTSRVEKEPVGVVGAIIPWNFPMLMASWKVAPALAAGCTVVLKPSEVTPLTALILAEIADEVQLPAGVLNVITGTGPEAGAPLSDHPDVDKLAFTGSVATGSAVMQAAAKNIKAVSLELGGKSPFIIFDDASVDAAVEWILFGIFWNQGEVCSATSRVLVHENLYERLLARLLEETAKITIGPGLEPGVLLGPLVNRTQYEKVLAAIGRGVEEGATLLCGGKRPAAFAKGYYLEPTIFADVDESSWIWKEEIFGPVVCIKSFFDEAEAVRLANDSRFGLAAAVMSNDKARCQRVSRRLRAGIVWVNCSQPTFTQAPWGGFKQSGIGRELGRWGLESYREVKQITEYVSDEPWGWYLKP
ncbi:aldehyde dehydrogenase family protein [Pseudomaricurvus sp. HS19]|uniref:aldehyde dehydrogenase family protein n=1 Tax=Pseudomaricurvus sp. HS19 TaxID=2692626 RepID=UPI001368B3B3|nr:aldehyde dehydrogenase family protein [Pseudomaricurvus sp. HS19]MYM64787.1 aldehyde dehydrogenase family protein [Pseudomaricurvus sp. HS19]